MKNLWSAIARLFDRREPATALACVRIAVGLVVLYSLLAAAWAGLVGTLWVDAKDGGFMPIHGLWPIRVLGGATPLVIGGLFVAAMVGATLLVVGLFSRLAALVTLICYASLVSVHADTSGGADIMITNALWLLALSRAGSTLSLEAKFRDGSLLGTIDVPAWPRYLLIFQIIVVYTAAGLNKFNLAWMPNSGYIALHYVLQDPTFTRFAVDSFTSLTPLTRIGTAITWHWETLTCLLLVYYYCSYTRERGGLLRRVFLRFDLRKPWTVIGVSLHIGILITLNVGPFSFIAVGYYFALWRPGEIEAFWCWLGRRCRKLRRNGTT